MGLSKKALEAKEKCLRDKGYDKDADYVRKGWLAAPSGERMTFGG